MSDSAVSQIIAALGAVATKLDSTAGHLYSVFVRQSILFAIPQLIIFAPLAFYGLIYANKFWTQYKASPNQSDPTAMFLFVKAVFSLGVAIFALLILLTMTLPSLINPEYGGIRLIFKMVQGTTY